jgi:hypothetical protein
VRSGRRAWWKVEQGLVLNALLTLPLLHGSHHTTAQGTLWGFKGCLAGPLGPLQPLMANQRAQSRS